MSQWMVRLRNSDLRIWPSILFAAIHERDDACQVALECEQLQVVEKFYMRLETIGNAFWPLHVRRLFRALFLSVLDSSFDVTKRLEVIVNLSIVAGAKSSLQRSHTFGHRIQNARSCFKPPAPKPGSVLFVPPKRRPETQLGVVSALMGNRVVYHGNC